MGNCIHFLYKFLHFNRTNPFLVASARTVKNSKLLKSYFEINGRTIFKQKLNKTSCSLTFVLDNNFVPNYML